MHAVAWWPTVVMVVLATASDLRTLKIPNWLVFPFVGSGLLVASCLHGWTGAGRSLCGLLLGMFVTGVLAALRALGMGDVKLFGAIGAWIGPSQLFIALIFTGLAGGLIALGWAVRRGICREMLRSSGGLLAHLGRRGLKPHPELALDYPAARKMPYAPAIAIGTLLSFFAG